MRNLFKPHQHICAVYETEEEHLALASEYVADGLRKDERCLYVARTRAALARFNGALTRAGIDVDAVLKSRALVEATNDEAHLVEGRFDTERMMRLLNDAVEAALNAGFTALRTCGDMSWLLEDAPGSAQVVEYEVFLNQFFQSVRASGMCLYDRRRLPAHLMEQALDSHSSVFLERHHKPNPFYRAPSIARTSRKPRDVSWKMGELRRSRARA